MEYKDEDLVSFETAELAKEKGFDWETCNYWVRYSEESEWEEDYDEEANFNSSHYSDGAPYTLSRPLQQQLQKWLRLAHGIEVSSKPTIFTGEAKASYYTPMLNEAVYDYRNKYKTYEEALEVALVAGLELVK